MNLSALTLANTYYLLSKELSKKIANVFLRDSARLFKFVDMPDETIRKAIAQKHKDFEDDLHYFASLQTGLDFIVTRNKQDYRDEGISVVDAEELINNIEDAG